METETFHDGVCEGDNFLGIGALMAQYDEVLAEVVSLPARATKYLVHVVYVCLCSCCVRVPVCMLCALVVI